eukprot:GEMP01001915.1.p1 GENE.GEMP01001915.1~~GEMP01001915.1.p1  ORF type:complete len:1121 (+),score=255.63 GEMP01001915.1:583-3945(+)
MSKLLGQPLSCTQLPPADFPTACRYSSLILTQLAPTFERMNHKFFHRDVCDRNVLVEGEEFFLVDLGSAVDATLWKESLWRTAHPTGDAKYWPPAAWRKIFASIVTNPRQYVERMDMFALGVLALEVFGRRYTLAAAHECPNTAQVVRLVTQAWSEYWSLAKNSSSRLFAYSCASLRRGEQDPRTLWNEMSCSRIPERHEDLLNRLVVALQNVALCTDLPPITCAFASVVKDMVWEKGQIKWTEVRSKLSRALATPEPEVPTGSYVSVKPVANSQLQARAPPPVVSFTPFTRSGTSNGIPVGASAEGRAHTSSHRRAASVVTSPSFRLGSPQHQSDMRCGLGTIVQHPRFSVAKATPSSPVKTPVVMVKQGVSMLNGHGAAPLNGRAPWTAQGIGRDAEQLSDGTMATDMVDAITRTVQDVLMSNEKSGPTPPDAHREQAETQPQVQMLPQQSQARAVAQQAQALEQYSQTQLQVQADAEAKAEAQAEALGLALAQARAKAEAEAAAQTQAQSHALAEAQAQAQTETQAQAQAQAQSETRAEALAHGQAQTQLELQAQYAHKTQEMREAPGVQEAQEARDVEEVDKIEETQEVQAQTQLRRQPFLLRTKGTSQQSQRLQPAPVQLTTHVAQQRPRERHQEEQRRTFQHFVTTCNTSILKAAAPQSFAQNIGPADTITQYTTVPRDATLLRFTPVHASDYAPSTESHKEALCDVIHDTETELASIPPQTVIATCTAKQCYVVHSPTQTLSRPTAASPENPIVPFQKHMDFAAISATPCASPEKSTQSMWFQELVDRVEKLTSSIEAEKQAITATLGAKKHLKNTNGPVVPPLNMGNARMQDMGSTIPAPRGVDGSRCEALPTAVLGALEKQAWNESLNSDCTTNTLTLNGWSNGDRIATLSAPRAAQRKSGGSESDKDTQQSQNSGVRTLADAKCNVPSIDDILHHAPIVESEQTSAAPRYATSLAANAREVRVSKESSSLTGERRHSVGVSPSAEIATARNDGAAPRRDDERRAEEFIASLVWSTKKAASPNEGKDIVSRASSKEMPAKTANTEASRRVESTIDRKAPNRTGEKGCLRRLMDMGVKLDEFSAELSEFKARMRKDRELYAHRTGERRKTTA